MDDLVTKYFQIMFSTSGMEGNMDFLKNLKGRVSNTMNEELSKEFTWEEIFRALQ